MFLMGEKEGKRAEEREEEGEEGRPKSEGKRRRMGRDGECIKGNERIRRRGGGEKKQRESKKE